MAAVGRKLPRSSPTLCNWAGCQKFLDNPRDPERRARLAMMLREKVKVVRVGSAVDEHQDEDEEGYDVEVEFVDDRAMTLISEKVIASPTGSWTAPPHALARSRWHGAVRVGEGRRGSHPVESGSPPLPARAAEANRSTLIADIPFPARENVAAKRCASEKRAF